MAVGISGMCEIGLCSVGGYVVEAAKGRFARGWAKEKLGNRSFFGSVKVDRERQEVFSFSF